MAKCPSCGNIKKGWFKLCFECNEKLKQVPKCEICNTDVPDGHTLCKTHWKEKQEHKIINMEELLHHPYFLSVDVIGILFNII